jgi:Holliday junction resolvase RusA-like endonuclease
MRGDIDGRVKLPLDLLVSLGITDDDRHCIHALVERDPSVPAGRCIVVAEAA